MFAWAIFDNEHSFVDIFRTAKGAYSYMQAEVERYSDENPDILSESQAFLYKQQMLKNFKRDPYNFSIGDIYGDFYYHAAKVDVKD